MDNLNWDNISNKYSITHLKSVQDEQTLYAKMFTNSTHPKKVLCLFHDLCDSSGEFNQFTQWILDHVSDVKIYTLDYVGHGQSSGTRGHFDDFHNLVIDQLEFLKSIEIESDQDLYLIGHGLGGLVTIDLYNKFSSQLKVKPKGLILSNFIFYFDHLILKSNLYKKLLAKKSTSHLRLIKAFEFHKLTGNQTRIHDLCLDPLFVHRPTLVSLNELRSKSKVIYQDSYYIDLPVYIAWSDNDPYLLKNGINYFLKGIKKEYLSEKNYSFMKHDLYNETDSVQFYEDIKVWILNNEIK